jgi:two-component system, cell cycle response regulator
MARFASFQIELYKSAVRDTLTSGLKKEHFADRLNEEVAYAVRHNAPLALIFWDLDRFKAVNDTHGHLVGDRVLAATANAVHALVCREDIFARCGGEEFAVACRPDAARSGAPAGRSAFAAPSRRPVST